MMTLAIVAFCASFLAQTKPSQVNSTGVDLRCGEYCLALSLKAIGIASPSVSELESRLGQPGPMGFSIKQLAEVAESYGAFTLGVDTTLENLESRERPFVCIALDEKRGHFFCIADVDRQSVQIIDPPTERTVARDAFPVVWDGRALLISDRPLAVFVPRRNPFWLVLGVSSILISIFCVFRIRLANRRRMTRANLLMILLAPSSIFTSPGCNDTTRPINLSNLK